jgi:hypothetical protein
MTRVLLAVLSFFLAVPTASALTVTLNVGGTSYLAATAQDGVSADTQYLYPAALPDLTNATATLSGASSTVYSDLSNAAFEISFDHVRTGSYQSAAHATAFIYFSVDEDVDYLLEGTYTAIDPDGRRVVQQAGLYDFTAGSGLFSNTQHSDATPNETFTLGLAEGDAANGLAGSLTGTLIAGHEYRLQVTNYMQAVPSASPSGASASGYTRLSFVPEPATALLLLSGALAITARRELR